MSIVLRCLCVQLAIASFLLTQTSSTEAHGNNTGSCAVSERSALVRFKAGLSDPADRLSTWQGDHCCRWKGIRCSKRTSHVIKLDLQGSYDSYLGGNISSSLAGLERLRYLDLSGNSFSGFQLAETLPSLHHLRYLNLSSSGFVGRIPPQLGNLTDLRYLSLGGNADTYSTDITWLSRLSSLEHLDLSSVNLSTIPNWLPVVNMLPSLKVLLLTSCQLNNSPDSLVHSNLTSLETLDISFNLAPKRLAPNWFWGLTSLKLLDISWSQFSGPIPDEIGNMTSMVELYLSHNNLVGMIPSNLKKLCNLETLFIHDAGINGSITEFFQRLPSCSWNKFSALDLSNNSLTGSLPTKLQESWLNLTFIYLGGNKLTGQVPLWIGELRKLTALNLMNNYLDGVIHEGHLSNLARLQRLLLSGNSIAITVNSIWLPPFNLTMIGLRSCLLGPKFPMWLRWQTPIYLDISNASISDIVPDWFWIMVSSLDSVRMQQNQLRGFLPSMMEYMRTSAMDLSSNQFSGPIPKLPINLTYLDLSTNKLSGLPLEFGTPLLEVLLLFGNSISGTIPSSLCKLTSLKLLDLSRNELTGSAPDCIVNQSTKNTESLSLSNLSLRNNNLSGVFPLFLKNCPDLIFLDLAHNKFFGTLPSWIGEKLPSLAFLRLRSNMFHGHIPLGLTKLANLQYLDLSNNNMSGSIPKSIVNCTRMILSRDKSDKFNGVLNFEDVVYRSDVDYTENFTIVTKGQERLYTGEVIYMVNLDLSCNNITGEIPEEIGALVALKSLNLSWNALSAKIPEKIGALVQVESLDLSHNELFGKIPTGLSALTSLSHLNLSYNNLSGEIPSGNQLQTLDDQEYIYVGNPGLCGSTIPKKCPGIELIPATPEHHEDAGNMISFYIAMSSGYVMGLWVVFCTFLFKRKWRIFWFSFCDSLYNRVYVKVAVSWASWTSKDG
ncbi:receptor-like protein EIX2 [Triticum urartu]|nr:receptor-like protein EIX2 [Triticum urartu]XP_048567366.1 receptor-like protein EIX2 [Triticum urartu]XP_048567367.1 receptor-like protein EIX2 [Triticum urartu]